MTPHERELKRLQMRRYRDRLKAKQRKMPPEMISRRRAKAGHKTAQMVRDGVYKFLY